MKRTRARWESGGQMNPVVRFSSMKLLKSCKFLLGQGVNWTIGRSSALIQGDLEIIWSWLAIFQP